MVGARAAQALYDSEATLRLVARELGELCGDDDGLSEPVGGSRVDAIDADGPTLGELLRRANCEIGDVLRSLT